MTSWVPEARLRPPISGQSDRCREKSQERHGSGRGGNGKGGSAASACPSGQVSGEKTAGKTDELGLGEKTRQKPLDAGFASI